jgi:hypothetical protein
LDLKSSTKQFKVPQSNSKIHADVLWGEESRDQFPYGLFVTTIHEHFRKQKNHIPAAEGY